MLYILFFAAAFIFIVDYCIALKYYSIASTVISVGVVALIRFLANTDYVWILVPIIFVVVYLSLLEISLHRGK